MARLTVRLPETLHEQLTARAEQEGVSLNQYIVYSLTRDQAGPAYVARPARSSPEEQRSEFDALVERLGKATDAEFDEILAEREEMEPESGLTPEIVERVRARLAEKNGAR